MPHNAKRGGNPSLLHIRLCLFVQLVVLLDGLCQQIHCALYILALENVSQAHLVHAVAGGGIEAVARGIHNGFVIVAELGKQPGLELIGIVNVVYFSPDEMRFVKAGPDERRRFLDISLSQQSKTYFKSLAKYNKILQQRNTLLKNENRNENLKTLLSIWDEGMAEVGANLILARKNYVKKLSTLAKDSHFELSDGKETLSLQYECAIKGDTYDEIYNNLLSAFSTSVERDRALMYTSQGPHRDDIKIILNDVDARKFASQGQQRSVSLSVKIAELTLFKNETGEAPILLLDDVLSELDVARREKLIELANRTQTVITCTEFDVKPLNLSKLYVVKNGTVAEKKIK